MHLSADRRRFLTATSSAFAALVASGCTTRGAMPLVDASRNFDGYGALVPDPAGMLDLPPGFSYRVLSSLGGAMDDGGTVPDKADGMGCFDIGNGEIALVRNHELVPTDDAGGVFAKGYGMAAGQFILPGGTTTLVLDKDTLAVKRQFRSLGGTIRNCAGGTTPWGSWLTCEEFVSEPQHIAPDKLNMHHGWVFEVPARAGGLIDPLPLKAMGRFNHEAACVDPATGLVYMTEDRPDSALYRFLPDSPGRLAAGGKLQAMVLEGIADTRNSVAGAMPLRQAYKARWIDLDNVEAPEDDLRMRAAAQGGAIIARGEGMHMGDGEVYVCSTSGGFAKFGQIFRLVPGRGVRDDRFELFFESENAAQFNYGDNLVVAPNGHLIVCEDQYTDVVDNHLKLITPDGRSFDLARLNMQTELAGACFSPDGSTMFVNAYAPTRTLAITGPWAA
ncbi:alkaline phosphatase PhoX [Qipengyuania marisflavi]|uniref:DUF839 domain-containing protein n=1 Tax=Qipengyuania marisflavi TaxID=2486356 RepID=A0A5S3P3I1_9SPHN|nr:alkaline phosphatase PhoX [Qipengyuania marisflavi]TMM47313.1 DUF839 domain-containing protein [Qipengyuania marisflavi]